MGPVMPFGGARNDTTTDCRLDSFPSGYAAETIRHAIAPDSGAATHDSGTVRGNA